MSLIAALLLVGQVGSGGYVEAPAGDPAPVQVDAQDPTPLRPQVAAPATIEDTPPTDPGLGSAPAVISAPENDAAMPPLRAEPSDSTDRPTSMGPMRPRARPAQFAEPAAAPASQPAAAPAQPAGPPGFRAAAPASAPPAAATAEPPASSQQSQTLQIASSMITEILTPDAQSAPHVRRIPLIDAVARLGDPGLQSTAIRAYWDLAFNIARLRYTSDKVRVLSEVTAPSSASDAALLEEALTAAEADEAAAQDSLLTAQYNFLRVTGLPLESTLPWPADPPLIAPYRTQFETIFAGRPAPLSVRQIHHGLPGKLWLIEKRVLAMAAAENTSDTMLNAYKRNQASVNQILSAVDRLDTARQAFLQSVVDYNQQIADYSLQVVGVGVGPQTLVATLIPSASINSGLVNIRDEVRQATAAEPASPGRSTR